jgi:hypothetical protein
MSAHRFWNFMAYYIQLNSYAVNFLGHTTPERIRAFTKVMIDNTIRFAEEGWGGMGFP